MAVYLLDTNVALRFVDDLDPAHPMTARAVAALFARADEPMLTPQVLVEFWAVATRPTASNGLGWSVEQTKQQIGALLVRFKLIEESPRVFLEWRRLVELCGVQGKQVHDARLAAVLLANGHQNILTLNASDFHRYPGIVAVHPSILIVSPPPIT